MLVILVIVKARCRGDCPQADSGTPLNGYQQMLPARVTVQGITSRYGQLCPLNGCYRTCRILLQKNIQAG
ncbi:MAG: hypothetical protein D5S03_07295 [Desulfonatronospira sp. MSAO_Bac3]|nr:MAG: hypothetical protein D5S03_07295 [Desulfonatronospira sp. MSAO_Bac3]